MQHSGDDDGLVHGPGEASATQTHGDIPDVTEILIFARQKGILKCLLNYKFFKTKHFKFFKTKHFE